MSPNKAMSHAISQHLCHIITFFPTTINTFNINTFTTQNKMKANRNSQNNIKEREKGENDQYEGDLELRKKAEGGVKERDDIGDLEEVIFGGNAAD